MFGESLSAPEAYHRLKARGHDCLLVCRQGSGAVRLAFSDPDDRLFVTPPEDSFDACVKELSNHLANQSVQAAILALEDAALVTGQAIELGEGMAFVTEDMVRLAMDKPAQYRLAEKSGFKVPEWCLCEGTQGDWQGADCPVIVKPASAGWVKDDRFQRGRSYFASSPQKGLEIAAEQDYACIVQMVVEGCGEGVFGMALDGECHRLSGHQRVRMMNPAGSGSSACRSIDTDQKTLDTVKNFVNRSPIHGMFMIELLRSRDGSLCFMELNARAWGSLALAHHRGFEYAEWQVEHLLGQPLSPWSGPGEHRLCRHLGRECVHALHLVRGNRGGAANWPSRASILKMLRPGEPSCWYNSFPGRRWFQFADAVCVLASQLRRNRA